MQKRLMIKLIVLSVVFGALLIALGAAYGLIKGREARRAEAVSSVAMSTGGPQQVTGPVLIVPYTRGAWNGVMERRVTIVLPKKLSIEATTQPERRARGIYEATVATTELRIRGQFLVPEPLVAQIDQRPLNIEAVRLAVGVSDNRGIQTTPTLRLNGVELATEPGIPELTQGGFSVPLGMGTGVEGKPLDFELSFTLSGTQSIQWTPGADEVDVSVSSPWAHPSFVGQFLPRTRSISDAGFSAHWTVNRFATGLPKSWDVEASSNALYSLEAQGFGVSLVDPVDVYLLSERATKYGFLFLVLTFGAFFLFELLAGLRIHPLQYGLVGIAQAIFFVVLLALAEHISFRLAYWIAALGGTAIITGYAHFALAGTKRALLFGGCLIALYGMMQVLLFSEDHALLLGALMLFGLTALVMFLTRHVDWYRVDPEPSPSPAPRP